MMEINRQWLKKTLLLSLVAGLVAASLSVLKSVFLKFEGRYIDAVVVLLALGITYGLDYKLTSEKPFSTISVN